MGLFTCNCYIDLKVQNEGVLGMLQVPTIHHHDIGIITE